MIRRLPLAVAVLAAGVLSAGLAACGSDDEPRASAATAPARTVTVTRTQEPQARASQTTATTTPGTTNPSDLDADATGSGTGAGTTTTGDTEGLEGDPTDLRADPGEPDVVPGDPTTSVDGDANVNPELPGVPSTLPPSQIGPDRDIGRLPEFFSRESPWNTPAENVPVAPNSGALIEQAALRRFVDDCEAFEDLNVTNVRQLENDLCVGSRRTAAGLFINTVRWTTPIVTEQGGVATRIRCRQLLCGSDDDVTSLRIPAEENPDPRYDGWFTVLDTQGGIAYDLWRARREVDGSISYQFIRQWRIEGPGFLRPDTPSARGSGLPLFAGVITLDEIRDGQIDHALAISLPGPAEGNYVQPASATDGVGERTSIPEGARIRLKPDADLGRLPGGTNRRVARMIVEALQTYGAIVVDRARVPTLYAQRSTEWRRNFRIRIFGNELQNLTVDDFEVLPFGRRLSYPPSRTTTQVGGGGTGGTTTGTTTGVPSDGNPSDAPDLPQPQGTATTPRGGSTTTTSTTETNP